LDVVQPLISQLPEDNRPAVNRDGTDNGDENATEQFTAGVLPEHGHKFPFVVGTV
jgi:hypothetical protein